MALTILDAGVLIAILDSSDVHHQAARQAVADLLDRQEEFAIPVSAYAEVLVGAYRGGSGPASVVDRFLDALPVRVEPATAAIAHIAAKLRADHGPSLRLPDALVIATAIDRKAAVILTTDAGWPRLPVPVVIVSGGSSPTGTWAARCGKG